MHLPLLGGNQTILEKCVTNFGHFFVTLLSRETTKEFRSHKKKECHAVFFTTFQCIPNKGLDQRPGNELSYFALLFNSVSVERV